MESSSQMKQRLLKIFYKLKIFIAKRAGKKELQTSELMPGVYSMGLPIGKMFFQVKTATAPTLHKTVIRDSSDTKKEIFYINVPYRKKERIKELGARWDSLKKSWAVPVGADVNLFWKWLSTINPLEINIRSYGFYVAVSSRLCWKCNSTTKVFAFLLPRHHQIKKYEEEDDELEYWESPNEYTRLSYIRLVNNKALERMLTFSTRYYFDHSQVMPKGYYMNHCQMCNAKLGDFYTHDEFDEGFSVITKEGAQQIKLYWFNELFEASSSYTDDVPLIDSMRKM
jgi:hypothetical protein